MVKRYLLFLVLALLTVVIRADNHEHGHALPEAISHPRLILKNSDKDAVKKVIEDNQHIAKIHKRIIANADEMLGLPLLERKMVGRRMLGVSQEALKRILYLSYAYRVTDMDEYARRAIDEMLAVCDFPDWNPDHFLDVAEMTAALAVGYDWLYDVLTPEERSLIVDAINNKAFTPSLDEKKMWFLRASNNWNSVCNAGLTLGAIAVMDEIPHTAAHIINRSVSSCRKVMEVYSPDGGYPEGYNYWDYGTSFQVLMIDALESSFGKDFGLPDFPGFLDSAKWMLYMTAPSGQCFNFSDCSGKALSHICMWWFAGRTEDNSLLYLDEKSFTDNKYQFYSSRLLPFLPIFASRLAKNEIDKPKDNILINRGKTPVFVYRSGWDSPNDAYLALKGGSASTTHAHMDAGSFVYERSGVRWAMDLGSQDYNSLESKGIDLWNAKQEGERWEIMRMRNDCHNTLTVDSARHIVNAHAEILHTFKSPDRRGAVVDLTSTLGKVKMAHREVSLDKDNNLVVIDSIHTGNEPISLTWVMVTPSCPEIIDNRNILLNKDDKQMCLTFESEIDVLASIWDNSPMHDYDEPNPGTVRVGYSTTIPANTSTVITVTLTACQYDS